LDEELEKELSKLEGESEKEVGEITQKGEEAGEELLEAPILCEVEDIEIDAGYILKEPELEDFGKIEDIEIPSSEGEEETPIDLSKEEIPDIADLEAGEAIISESTEGEKREEEETQPVIESELEKNMPEPEETLGETVETTEEITSPEGEEILEGGVELTEEEEKILKKDIDLSSSEAEETEASEEEVVSLSGEELDKIVEEEEIIEEEPETLVIDKTLLNDITVILKYLDDLLGALPEEKIKEFANSKYFSLYKEVFNKLGIT